VTDPVGTYETTCEYLEFWYHKEVSMGSWGIQDLIFGIVQTRFTQSSKFKVPGQAPASARLGPPRQGYGGREMPDIQQDILRKIDITIISRYSVLFFLLSLHGILQVCCSLSNIKRSTIPILLWRSSRYR